MKYLVSPIQLGRLLQENDIVKRDAIVKEILSLYYIIDTSDDDNLDDHVEINLPRRKARERKWKRKK